MFNIRDRRSSDSSSDDEDFIKEKKYVKVSTISNYRTKLKLVKIII